MFPSNFVYDPKIQADLQLHLQQNDIDIVLNQLEDIVTNRTTLIVEYVSSPVVYYSADVLWNVNKIGFRFIFRKNTKSTIILKVMTL